MVIEEMFRGTFVTSRHRYRAHRRKNYVLGGSYTHGRVTFHRPALRKGLTLSGVL